MLFCGLLAYLYILYGFRMLVKGDMNTYGHVHGVYLRAFVFQIFVLGEYQSLFCLFRDGTKLVDLCHVVGLRKGLAVCSPPYFDLIDIIYVRLQVSQILLVSSYLG